MTTVTLGAPCAGWAMPLVHTPDQVFADRMMGDGVAIDPLEGAICAPCDATVATVAPSGHAVTLALDNGAEVLIHVGIDTVALNGTGFTPRVVAGDRVAAGAPLIDVALDAVALRATSLVTPIVVVGEGFVVTSLATGRVAAGDPLLAIKTAVCAPALAPTGEDTAWCDIVVPLMHGIHARPAARIGAALKPFSADVRVIAGGRESNARSIVGLMKLAIVQGTRISVTGRGVDARAAVTAIAQLIEGGMEESGAAAASPPRAPCPPPMTPSSAGSLVGGVRAAPGQAVGPAFRFAIAEVDVPQDGIGSALEAAALANAITAVRGALGRLADMGDDISAAHFGMLEDPELAAAAQRHVIAGRSAGWAWREAMREQADALAATGDARMMERVADLRDVERRVLYHLTGLQSTAPEPPAGAILIADDLLPSDFLALRAGQAAGIATAGGGPTSHVAILAAAAGVPMLVACGPAASKVVDGATILLDADAGLIDLAPSLQRLQEATRAIADARRRDEAALGTAQEPCRTLDSVRIEVFANCGSAADASAAVAAGAEGCGLLRTEFLFLDRASAPSEDEQRDAYALIARELAGRPLIVRTLDIGGDKPVPYLPFPHEENPALGARGIRLGLARPDLLNTQLRAILRGVPAAQCRIMLPMIVDGIELRAVRAMLEDAAASVGCDVPPLGVMVETPAAALLAHDLARDAAFLSLGTNDLTQYVLAADRGNPAVAGRIDALHPAVLHLIARAGEAAAVYGRPLGVCGAIASDPAAAALLIGLGVTELSATPAAIPVLKLGIRALTLDDCRALAARALAAGSAADVRALLEQL